MTIEQICVRGRERMNVQHDIENPSLSKSKKQNKKIIIEFSNEKQNCHQQPKWVRGQITNKYEQVFHIQKYMIRTNFSLWEREREAKREE